MIPARPFRDSNEHGIARGYMARGLGSYEFDVSITNARVGLYNYRAGGRRSWAALNRSINQLRIALYLHQLMKEENHASLV